MNIQSKTVSDTPTTADEFLRWNEGREGKREFVRGRVVEMMINVTRNHARLAARLLIALGQRLNLAMYDVSSAYFGVKTPDGVRFPDVLVDRRTGESRGSDLAATAPVLLAEVLSASSHHRDFTEKLAEYTGLPSLKHYVILSPDAPRVWLWSRVEDQSWTGPQIFADPENTVELTHLGASIPLGELYAGSSG